MSLLVIIVHRLIEMDEAIEALDAAIQYKDSHIHVRQLEVRQSQQLLAQVCTSNIIYRVSQCSYISRVYRVVIKCDLLLI